MNDENEIIRLSCEKCKESCEGTYKELFGGIPSLKLLPKMVCKECGRDIELDMTGEYKIVKPTTGFERNMAYPQYKGRYGSHVIISTDGWARLQAHVLKLKKETHGVSEEVKKHWDNILAGKIPFGMRIAKTENQNEEET